MELILATREKVSEYSIPSTYEKPLATRHALFLSIEPFVAYLALQNHLQRTRLCPLGRGTRSYVCFFIKEEYSSVMATPIQVSQQL
jgi:hypothetical protein